MSAKIDLEMDVLLQSQDLSVIQQEFNKYPPSLNTFTINLESLRATAQEVKFNDSSWEYNPEKFCIKYYSTPDLALVVLLVNSVSSRFSFTAANLNGIVIAPFIDDVYKLLANR